MSHGISLVPEDRKRQGLVLIQTILKNISLPNLDRFSSFMRIDQNAELAEARKFAKSLSIKAPSRARGGGVPLGRQPAEGRHLEVAHVRAAGSSSSTTRRGASTWAPSTRSTSS